MEMEEVVSKLDDTSIHNSANTMLMTSIDTDLQSVEQHLERPSFSQIFGGAGRAVRNSITTALETVRNRLETVREQGVNNNTNGDPSAMSSSQQSVRVQNLSQRLIAAEMAHSNQIPLGQLSEIRRRSSVHVPAGFAISKANDDDNDLIRRTQDEGKSPYRQSVDTGTSRRRSSLLLPSRRKADELGNVQSEYERYGIRSSVRLTRLGTTNNEGVEILLEQNNCDSQPNELLDTPVKKSLKMNDDAMEIETETPILLTQKSRKNLNTSSHSVLFAREDQMSPVGAISDTKYNTEVYSWGSGLSSLHDDTDARLEAENSKLELTSRVGRSDIVSCSFGPNHSACCDVAGKVFAKGLNVTGAVDPERESEANISRPVILESLGIARIIQIGCGADHTVALRANGTVLSWGSNEYGQLGHRLNNHKLSTFCRPSMMITGSGRRITAVACGDGFTLCLTSRMTLLACGDELIAGYRKDEDILPAVIPTLMDLPIVSIAAGRRHAAAVTAHGNVFLWGENPQGCCGREYPRSFGIPVSLQVPPSKFPSKGRSPPPPLANWGFWEGQNSSHTISIADDVAVVEAALGNDHTVLLTKSGRLLVFGSNAAGQLGLADSTVPSVYNLEALEHPELIEGNRFVSAQAGSEHTLLLDNVGDVWQFDRSYDPRNPVPVLSKKGIQWIAAGGMNSVAVVSKRDQVGTTSTLSETDQLGGGEISLAGCVEDLLHLLESKNNSTSTSQEPLEAVIASLSNRTNELLKTPSVLNSLFLDPTELDDLFSKLLVADSPSFQKAIVKSIESGIMSGLQSLDSDSARLVFPEQVRFLLLYLQCPLFADWKRDDMVFDRRGDLIMSLCNAILELPYEGYRALISWASTYSREYFVRFIVKPLLRQLGKGLSVSAGAETRSVPAIATLLKWLYNASERADNGVVPEDFHSDDISKMKPEQLLEDLIRFKKSSKEQRNTTFFLCNNSFLFSPCTKRVLLQMESEMNMFRTAASGATYNPAENVFEVNPFYVLEIDRERLLTQTLQKISKAKPSNLRKKLTISFKGEEGLDAGGVTREFFQLLSEQLFAVDTGMWTNKYQDGTITWFNAECSWNDEGYFLSGVLVGLAVYNSVVLDVHFPQAVYRKLLGCPLGLEDMVDEEVKRGLQSLLDYDGNDVEDVFCLSFDVAWTDLGVEKRRDLQPNGSNIPVTADNKEEYVLLYTEWLLQDSIYPQYDAFERGFMRVMEDSSFELLRSEELELLVAGTPDLDFEAFRKNATYEGFTEDSDVIQNFWKFINSASREEQVHFLKFTTGSPKAPVGGLGTIELKIQRAGPDSNHLPTSHTCFNTLLLPDYGCNYFKLADRLGRAVLECEGFGLK